MMSPHISRRRPNCSAYGCAISFFIIVFFFFFFGLCQLSKYDWVIAIQMAKNCNVVRCLVHEDRAHTHTHTHIKWLLHLKEQLANANKNINSNIKFFVVVVRTTYSCDSPDRHSRENTSSLNIYISVFNKLDVITHNIIIHKMPLRARTSRIQLDRRRALLTFVSLGFCASFSSRHARRSVHIRISFHSRYKIGCHIWMNE